MVDRIRIVQKHVHFWFIHPLCGTGRQGKKKLVYMCLKVVLIAIHVLDVSQKYKWQ
jgi:hypothetical protein